MDGQGDPEVPGERRLDRPPSDRYRVTGQPGVPVEGGEPAGGGEPSGAGQGSPTRALVTAIAAAAGGGLVITVAGGLLTMTAGLVVIAAVLGWVVGALVGLGGSASPQRQRRRVLAAGVAIGGVALGQAGLWLVARQEGGTLDPVAYLAEVFGALVPLEVALAAGFAWWRA
jgi:hypothetical protein